MKTFIFTLAICLLSLTAYAQTTFSITIPENVATREWAEKYIERKIDSTAKAQAYVKPAPEKCDRGPVIKTFKAITNTNSLVQFDGNKVTEIDYVITGTSYYFKGHITPDSNILNIAYPQAAKGKYNLALIATNCTGGDSMAFTIK